MKNMERDTQMTPEATASRDLLPADVLGTVSHELRGPLTAIKGYASTLLRHERRLARDERRQYLQAIREASDRLEVIIERLLELSQLETGQVTLQLAPVDMAALVREALLALEERVEHTTPGHFSFQLLLEQADGSPTRSVPLILADRRRLRDVLDNLLDNAIHYSPEGGTVSVRIRPVIPLPSETEARVVAPQAAVLPTAGAATSPPAPMLELCISDGGLGIPAEHLERIFTRFHRVDTRLIREVNGLGLGLTMCKYLVELHSGLIWAENSSGEQGSVFFLRFPLGEIKVPVL
jgi:signal transduction histidine kinase